MNSDNNINFIINIIRDNANDVRDTMIDRET